MVVFEVYKTGNSFFSNKKEAVALFEQRKLGELKNGKVMYSLFEVLYLLDEKKIEIIECKKRLSFEGLIKKDIKKKYVVFKDLRDKGYVLKEGLKFGVDFRVYEKNAYREGHATYLLYIVEKSSLDLRDFSAKSRVSHSTNKKLLLAVVDSEEDITYFEVDWKKI
jgi:tRNA-intron endonuclease